jgi:histidine triad (HIT) family protein
MTDCIFCRIATGEIPARLAPVRDGGRVPRLQPQAPVHPLIIPTLTGANDTAAAEPGPDELMGLAARAAERIDQNATGWS